MASKKRSGFVYSTDDDFFGNEEPEMQDNIRPEDQHLEIRRDRKMRKGKTVTLITGFECGNNVLKALASELKSHCGTGGSYTDGTIIIQGDLVDKTMNYLVKGGYNVRKIGG